MSYFPEPHAHSKNKMEIEIDLSNYATKSDLKNATGVDISDFVKKTDFNEKLKNYNKKIL